MASEFSPSPEPAHTPAEQQSTAEWSPPTAMVRSDPAKWMSQRMAALISALRRQHCLKSSLERVAKNTRPSPVILPALFTLALDRIFTLQVIRSSRRRPDHQNLFAELMSQAPTTITA